MGDIQAQLFVSAIQNPLLVVYQNWDKYEFSMKRLTSNLSSLNYLHVAATGRGYIVGEDLKVAKIIIL